jgi:hypothetical protein
MRDPVWFISQSTQSWVAGQRICSCLSRSRWSLGRSNVYPSPHQRPQVCLQPQGLWPLVRAEDRRRAGTCWLDEKCVPRKTPVRQRKPGKSGWVGDCPPKLNAQSQNVRGWKVVDTTWASIPWGLKQKSAGLTGPTCPSWGWGRRRQDRGGTSCCNTWQGRNGNFPEGSSEVPSSEPFAPLSWIKIALPLPSPIILICSNFPKSD